jgi:two-component sensor histidine kinase
LAESEWRGASIEAVLRDELSPYLDREERNIRIRGPSVVLESRLAVAMGMAFHELATNSAKYGVLEHGGTITVTWKTEEASSGRAFHLAWFEDTAEPPLLQ